jgi:TetR/AcrR family transcriptional regulator
MSHGAIQAHLTDRPVMSSNAPLDDAAPEKRGKGRPPRTASETQAVRRQILQAAALVFAEHGSHGISVELITQACEISRPKFYRHFKNADEVLEQVLQEANDRLIELLVSAIRAADDPMQKVEAGLRAWRAWGEQTGPVVRAIFAEMQDIHSPAYAHRQRVLKTMAKELDQMARSLGRAPFDPLQVETFVIGVEYLGYRFHFGPEAPTEALWQRTRHAMLRLAIGLLGGPLEWAHAPQLADVLGIKLD